MATGHAQALLYHRFLGEALIYSNNLFELFNYHLYIFAKDKK